MCVVATYWSALDESRKQDSMRDFFRVLCDKRALPNEWKAAKRFRILPMMCKALKWLATQSQVTPSRTPTLPPALSIFSTPALALAPSPSPSPTLASTRALAPAPAPAEHHPISNPNQARSTR